MTALQLIVLALIQGISEFLPVSSSAHLVLVGQFFQQWGDQGLAFDAAVHVGTLAAVVLYFRADLAGLVQVGLGRDTDPTRRRLMLGLALATVPALLVGALAADFIELWMRSPLLIAATTILFGLALGWADRAGSRSRPLDALSLRGALWIGLAQVLALVPGTSRSGVTITAGLALGLTREAAARFSFLLSIPIIAAAGGWGFLNGLLDGGQFEFGRFLLAAGISGSVAWLTIAAFMAWLQRFGMTPFVIYRLLLGAFLLYWFWPISGA
ncbi:MAG: undecaprenyl-diphosphate phosphatase [Gammaproteobacteria bacterium HGW-Gammaproteobacteria-8]|nr:MAG: undecaprenyl-diphosphate phosphatase [Gammaproteobacteria bacterium HGW-Gammaproteobacteria-8]